MLHLRDRVDALGRISDRCTIDWRGLCRKAGKADRRTSQNR
jgi:hypothetical protein